MSRLKEPGDNRDSGPTTGQDSLDFLKHILYGRLIARVRGLVRADVLVMGKGWMAGEVGSIVVTEDGLSAELVLVNIVVYPDAIRDKLQFSSGEEEAGVPVLNAERELCLTPA